MTCKDQPVADCPENAIRRDVSADVVWHDASATWPLLGGRRIGLMGDVHGDRNHIFRAANMFGRRGIRVIIQLGDFGMIWPRRNWPIDLNALDVFLGDQDQTLLFVDGNHEDHPLLETFPVSSTGIRWVGERIGHLPRGYRAVFSNGIRLAALGGANSIDRYRRLEGRDWWAQEQITLADLRVLGEEPVDVLLSHDVPLGVPSLDRHLASIRDFVPRQGIRYAERGRRMFHEGFVQVRPRLSLAGHYHWHVDETIEFETESESFATRVVVLDAQGASRGNCAILNLDDLSVEVIDVEGRPYLLDHLGVHR
ncbi:hypothetical protein SAMN04489806_0992 [Paramicrobacterium humi]|uniref:Calcineurin-like phosphoesterase n=1 Tax=Paramicrobacterium humi TaxID=640635 RepID=A0A1H4K334_9MICO|nr:metallophosphoesterase [Microbacterium humi]SEB52944.1 hypothetical protein SAMN04489806_0992 [Microbacterium humi]